MKKNDHWKTKLPQKLTFQAFASQNFQECETSVITVPAPGTVKRIKKLKIHVE